MANSTLNALALASLILARNWAGYHRMISELDLGSNEIQAAHLAAGLEVML